MTPGTQLGGVERGRKRTPLLFFENRRKCRIKKKCPDCVYLWIKCFIQNVVSRVSRRRNSNFFLTRSFISCALDEMFTDVSEFQETFPALKNFWLHAWALPKVIPL